MPTGLRKAPSRSHNSEMAALVTGSATSDEEVPGELFRRYERLSQGRSVP